MKVSDIHYFYHEIGIDFDDELKSALFWDERDIEDITGDEYKIRNTSIDKWFITYDLDDEYVDDDAHWKGYAHVSINLNATNEQLIGEFNKWIIEYRRHFKFPEPEKVDKRASSVKSVGRFRYWKLTHRVIQGYFHHFKALIAVGSSGDQIYFPV